MNDISLIEIELVDTTDFPKAEVLKDPEQIKHRKLHALKAILLGDNSNTHVKIVFEGNSGKQMVVTIVWGLTESYLLLKGSITIPLNRVHEIIL
jgi:hypothetical protein